MIQRKILNKETASGFQALHPTTKSVSIEFDGFDQKILARNGKGRVIVQESRIQRGANYWQDCLGEALTALLKKELVEFFSKIQSPNYTALRYWRDDKEQNRYSKYCDIDINTKDLEGIKLLYKKIGYRIEKVFTSTTRDKQIEVWAIIPSCYN
jgi:hypothetical protein